MTRFNPSGDIGAQLDLLLNEGLELNDNFRGALLEVTLDAGENTVQHGLGFIPTGFIVISKDKEGDIFSSRVNEWTEEALFLQSSVESQAVRLCVV